MRNKTVDSSPAKALLAGALILIIVGIFTREGRPSIHLYDTYYILSGLYLGLLLSLVFVFFWFIYRIAGAHMYSSYYSWVHIILTTISVVLIFIGFYDTHLSYDVFLPAILLFLGGILAMLVNIIRGVR